jgi:hypothetical protein
MGKYLQPGFNGLDGQIVLTLLCGIDVAVPAVEVALGKNVKKKIGGIL